MIQTRKKLLFLILSLALFVLFLARPAHSADLTQNLVNAPVSLHFSEIEVSELLQVLAKMGNTNFLLSESITGKITVHLNNTPWQTALHSILASRGLRLIRNGDIYWIGPHAEIQAFQKYRREDAALPFGGDHVNSPRQILIEARIVEADERFARELGVKLGAQANAISGNPEQTIASTSDLGVAGLSGFNPATVAATLVSKNAQRLLQLELSALETEGQGKILSNPSHHDRRSSKGNH
jgi:type IV pilus assembly protein PilQ